MLAAADVKTLGGGCQAQGFSFGGVEAATAFLTGGDETTIRRKKQENLKILFAAIHAEKWRFTQKCLTCAGQTCTMTLYLVEKGGAARMEKRLRLVVCLVLAVVLVLGANGVGGAEEWATKTDLQEVTQKPPVLVEEVPPVMNMATSSSNAELNATAERPQVIVSGTIYRDQNAATSVATAVREGFATITGLQDGDDAGDLYDPTVYGIIDGVEQNLIGKRKWEYNETRVQVTKIETDSHSPYDAVPQDLYVVVRTKKSNPTISVADWCLGETPSEVVITNRGPEQRPLKYTYTDMNDQTKEYSEMPNVAGRYHLTVNFGQYAEYIREEKYTYFNIKTQWGIQVECPSSVMYNEDVTVKLTLTRADGADTTPPDGSVMKLIFDGTPYEVSYNAQEGCYVQTFHTVGMNTIVQKTVEAQFYVPDGEGGSMMAAQSEIRSVQLGKIENISTRLTSSAKDGFYSGTDAASGAEIVVSMTEGNYLSLLTDADVHIYKDNAIELYQPRDGELSVTKNEVRFTPRELGVYKLFVVAKDGNPYYAGSYTADTCKCRVNEKRQVTITVRDQTVGEGITPNQLAEGMRIDITDLSSGCNIIWDEFLVYDSEKNRVDNDTPLGIGKYTFSMSVKGVSGDGSFPDINQAVTNEYDITVIPATVTVIERTNLIITVRPKTVIDGTNVDDITPQFEGFPENCEWGIFSTELKDKTNNTVPIHSSVTLPGPYKLYVYDLTIYNSDLGCDVTSLYDITVVPGEVTVVEQRPLTVNVESITVAVGTDPNIVEPEIKVSNLIEGHSYVSHYGYVVDAAGKRVESFDSPGTYYYKVYQLFIEDESYSRVEHLYKIPETIRGTVKVENPHFTVTIPAKVDVASGAEITCDFLGYYYVDVYASSASNWQLINSETNDAISYSLEGFNLPDGEGKCRAVFAPEGHHTIPFTILPKTSSPDILPPGENIILPAGEYTDIITFTVDAVSSFN